MKKRKKSWMLSLLCFTLLGILVFAGCSSKTMSDSNNSDLTPLAEGGYEENEISPPELGIPIEEGITEVLGIYPRQKNALDIFLFVTEVEENRREQFFHYQSMDCGDTWEPMDTQWYLKFCQEQKWKECRLQSVAMDKAGTLFCITRLNDGQLRLIKNAGGVCCEIKIADWYDPNFYEQTEGAPIRSFAVLSNGDIAVAFEQEGDFGFIYNGASGERKQRFPTTLLPMMVTEQGYGQIRYVEKTHAYEMIQCDYNAQETAQYAVDFDPLENYSMLGDHDTIYLVCGTSILRFAEDGGQGTLVMEGSGYTFGMPSWEIQKPVYSSEDQRFYLVLKNVNNGATRLFRYTYNPKRNKDTGEPLSIFTLNDSDTLRQAVSTYQILHPQQKVEVTVGVSDNLGVTKEDVIRVLNTELLAGKGADVFILDGLPVQSYIEKNVLSDLSEIAGSEAYFTNITSAFSTSHGTYAIPARYTIPLLTGEKALLDTLTGLPELAKKAQDFPLPSENEEGGPLPPSSRPLFRIGSPYDMVRIFYNTYALSLINQDNTLNHDALSELLLYTKDVNHRYYKRPLKSPWEGILQEQIGSFRAKDVYAEETLLGMAEANDFIDFSRWYRANPRLNQDEANGTKLYVAPLCGLSKNVYLPSVIAGVNAASPQQSQAKAFIEVLLSEDVQRPEFSEGFPVNRAAFQEAMKKSVDYYQIGYSVDMEQLAASLTTPVIIDETILGAILDEIKPYYNDEETLDEAVAHINAKLRTYLAEKS